MWYFVIAAIVSTAGLSATALGQQGCNNTYTCSPADASNTKYVCSSGGTRCYSPTSYPSIVPDKRPVFWFLMFSGGNNHFNCTPPNNHKPNPTGETWMWNDADRFDEQGGLKENMDNIWNAGFRRIVLERPVGGLLGNIPANGVNTKVTQAAYWPLKEKQKKILRDVGNLNADDLYHWIDSKRYGTGGDPSFEFGVFLGSWQGGSACTPCLTSSAGSTLWDCSKEEDKFNFTYTGMFFDPTSASSMEELYQNVKPWMDMGFDTIYFDNASTWDMDNSGNTTLSESKALIYVGPERLLDLMQSPDYSNIKIGGESIPRDFDNQDPIDKDFYDKAAWFMLYKTAVNRGWFTSTGALGTLPDLMTSTYPNPKELGICFGKPDTTGREYDIHTVADARDYGYVIWISNTKAIPFVQRLYDGEHNEFYNAMTNNGTNLGSIANFNADYDASGNPIINCDDYSLFYTNWATNYNANLADPSVWDGDIDNDDDVDMDDYCLFKSLADWSSMNCAPLLNCPN